MTFLGSIDGHLLKEMVLAGVSLLEKNKAALDALNVFPVPDGDTGTNMSLTMLAAAKELSSTDSVDISTVAEAVARGALKGARGNSGVILSQLYRGFARGLDKLHVADAKEIAWALKMGQEAAYKAVMKPKEGTILTVAREIAEKAVEYADKGGDLYGLIESVLVWGEDVLRRTPDMLPVLKQAGVIDAGGKGLLILYMGYKMVADGDSPEDIDLPQYLAPSLVTMDGPEEEAIEFGYCTEFLVQDLKQGVSERHILRLREKLDKIGDSVIAVGDLGMIKVHVHSNNPGKALQYGLSLGALSSVKIDNMREQHRHLVLEEEVADSRKTSGIDKEYGIVAVCSGNGLTRLMIDLGATEIVVGGQTMNPSTEDILSAAGKTGGKEVYLLPNNPNVILAAQQAAELSDGQKLHLIPTRSVPQGVAALIAFMPDRPAEANIKAMEEAVAAIKTGSVTYAIRDTKLGGRVIHQGDIMGLNETVLQEIGQSVEQVTCNLVERMIDAEAELVTLYYGEDITRQQADELAKKISRMHKSVETEVVQGGQPLYHYLISVE